MVVSRIARRLVPWLVLAALSLACGAGSSESTDPEPPEDPEPPTPPPSEAPAGPLTLESAQLTPADLGGDCALEPDAHGSIHAETMFQVGIEEPSGGKTRQGFVCDGEAVAVFFYDYGTELAAHDAAGWMGAQLWGTSEAPTAHNPDELLRRGALVAVVSSRRPAPLVEALARRRGFAPARTLEAPVAAPPSDDITDAQLDAFRARFDCEAHAPYCAALDAFGQGSATALPSTPTSRVGRAILAAGSLESVVYAVMRPTGLLDGAVTPDNQEEAAQLEATLEVLRAGETLPLDNPVASFVASLANNGQSVRETTVIGRSRTYTLDDRRIYYRSTAEGLVVLDVNAAGLVRVSLYRD